MKRARIVALFVGLALLLVADVIAIAWLDAHELETMGLAVGLLLLIWLAVVLTDPSITREDE